MKDKGDLVPSLMGHQAALFGHTQTAHNLLQRRFSRQLNNCMAGAQLIPQLANTQTWAELFQIQDAIVERLEQQGREWVEGCSALMQDYAKIKQANTLTKLMEQQANLVGQWGQLVGSQATKLMGLQENIEIDLGYWASQKIESK